MFSVGEVAAKNLVLYVGHLRDGGSQWCNRLLHKQRRLRMMKRIILVLTVLAIMAAMLVASAMPVFAGPTNFGQCHKLLNSGQILIVGIDTNSEFNEAFNPPKSQGNQPGTPARCQVP